MTTGTVVLEGLDRYALWDPMFEGARLVLNYRGERLSPTTVQGLSGGAFRIGGICPCAPTVAPAMGPQDLVRLLGYRAVWLSPLEGAGADDVVAWPQILTRIRAEVDAGRPVLLWHAFTMLEWDVVAGYDDAAGTLQGRGAYEGTDGYAEAPQDRAGAGDPALGAILIGERVGEPDIAGLEVASLQEAVRHARSQENARCCPGGPWRMLFGLACWDRWITGFRRPDYVASDGDHYCLGVYRTTHARAAPYLREVAERRPAAAPALTAAAEHLAAEAEALNAAADLFPGWMQPEKPDADLNRRVAERLQAARDAYARGVDEIATALGPLGAPAE